MKRIAGLIVIALLMAFPAKAQQYPSVPDHTVIGRIGSGSSSGPSQAVPFSTIWNAIVQPPSPTTLGGVESLTCSSHNWFNTLSTSGAFGCSQPSFSDLAGMIGSGQLPLATNSVQGISRGDGTTLSCSAGVCTAIGAATTSIDGAGATSVSNSTGPCALYENSSNKVACGPVRNGRTDAGSSVTVAAGDDIVVLTNGGVTAVSVPTCSSSNKGETHTIKDGAGSAALFNDTITPLSGNIDGASPLVLYINYEAVTLYCNGSQWNAI